MVGPPEPLRRKKHFRTTKKKKNTLSLWFKLNLPEPPETQEKLIKQKVIFSAGKYRPTEKFMKILFEVSENIIYSNLNMTAFYV